MPERLEHLSTTDQVGAVASTDAASVGTFERWMSLPLLFPLIILVVLGLFWPTTLAMIETWQRSSTYEHCYFVIPAVIAIVWWHSRTAVPLKPYWPGLIPTAIAGLLWQVGNATGAAVVAQLAVIGVIVAVALTTFGLRWARQMAFPLGFLFFAVPFGDELLPVLIPLTADVTVWALQLSGVPTYQYGSDFITPNGRWSVVEACGGVRYLVAALVTSYVFVWMQPWTASKRISFVLVALGLALVANWVRTYAIVQANLSTDHNMVGWIIFGMAMFGLFYLGTRLDTVTNRVPSHI